MQTQNNPHFSPLILIQFILITVQKDILKEVTHKTNLPESWLALTQTRIHNSCEDARNFFFFSRGAGYMRELSIFLEFIFKHSVLDTVVCNKSMSLGGIKALQLQLWIYFHIYCPKDGQQYSLSVTRRHKATLNGWKLPQRDMKYSQIHKISLKNVKIYGKDDAMRPPKDIK